MDGWETVYVGECGRRQIRIERHGSSSSRVTTSCLGSNEEITIVGQTPGELEERLVVYGQFTDSQADRIIRKLM